MEVESSAENVQEMCFQITEKESLEKKNDLFCKSGYCYSEIKKLRQRLHKLEKMYEISERSRMTFKKKLNAARENIRRMKNGVSSDQLHESLRSILNEDQIALLSKKYTKVPRWCNATLLNAYKLRFACGTSGYEEILRQKLPFPCVRTLTKKMENLKFNSGVIIDEVLDFLKIKICHFDNDLFKDCAIVMDEMSITPGTFYDTSTNTFLGNVTLLGQDVTQTATHALVIMLAGLSARWKQVVRYDFTGDSVQGRNFKPILDEIIIKAEEIGLRVHAITSDMGPANQAMWKAYGINVSRYSESVISCAHPCDENRQLYFYADAPHAFKNTKAGILNNSIVIIPNKFVEKHSLPTNVVNSKHIKDVVNEDKNIELKLAPKLREEYLNTKDHFQKMRVSNATRAFSEEVSSALEYLARDSLDERLTTAWFINFLSRWFNIMCSRSIANALSFKKVEKYQDTINFLNEAVELFNDMKIGHDGKWKPFQTALITSTKTIIKLSNYLLHNGFTYFLPSRLTQDCLENVFSVVRLKNVIPNALQFKNNLKLITISQYMKDVRSSSYDTDDREFLSEFLDILLQNRSANSHFLNNDASQIILNNPEQKVILKKTELNVLYHIAGYIIFNIKKNKKVCDTCINATKSSSMVCNTFNVLSIIKQKKQKSYFFVNKKTFQFFIQMERIFRLYYNHLRLKKINLKQFFITKYREIDFSLPECHNIKEKIILRYHAFRLKISSRKIKTKRNVIYASKSVAMHEKVK